MNSEPDSIAPLIEAKRKIEATIAVLHEKITLLNKRATALTQAINVLRSSDEELGLLEDVRHTKVNPPRVTYFDEAAVEKIVIDFMNKSGRGVGFQQIHKAVRDSDITCSEFGLRRVLNTCPGIERRGERHQTHYILK